MNKNVLFIALTLLSSIAAHSQIKKGAHFIGGSFGVGKTNNETDPGNAVSELTIFNFSPAYGYAIKENLVIGGDLVLQSGKFDYPNNIQKTTGLGAGFFVRKYKPLGKGFYLFGQGRFGVLHNKTTSNTKNLPNSESTTKQTNVGVSIYPGVSYAINKKLQLEVGLNDLLYAQYSTSDSKNQSSPNVSTQNSFTLGSNLTNNGGLVIGLRILINN